MGLNNHCDVSKAVKPDADDFAAVGICCIDLEGNESAASRPVWHSDRNVWI
jgi:hypothetical protein